MKRERGGGGERERIPEEEKTKRLLNTLERTHVGGCIPTRSRLHQPVSSTFRTTISPSRSWRYPTYHDVRKTGTSVQRECCIACLAHPGARVCVFISARWRQRPMAGGAQGQARGKVTAEKSIESHEHPPQPYFLEELKAFSPAGPTPSHGHDGQNQHCSSTGRHPSTHKYGGRERSCVVSSPHLQEASHSTRMHAMRIYATVRPSCAHGLRELQICRVFAATKTSTQPDPCGVPSVKSRGPRN